jgi:hypothetical protein
MRTILERLSFVGLIALATASALGALFSCEAGRWVESRRRQRFTELPDWPFAAPVANDIGGAVSVRRQSNADRRAN